MKNWLFFAIIVRNLNKKLTKINMKKTLSKLVLSLMATAIVATAVPLSAYADDDFDACPECPKSVVELTATPLNASVALEWSESTDDVGITGYRVYYGTSSVGETDQTYDSDTDAGLVTELTLSELENSTAYYFSVVAYDADENESPYWSPEATATPEEDLGGEDSEGPQVSDVEAINSTEVSVEFSEEVILPETDPQDAFSIENDDTFEALEVSAAIMDEEDDTNKTVIVTTTEQEADASYTLTVTSALEDAAGNPVESGITDQGTLTGSAEPKAAEDTEGPRVVEVEAQDNTHVVVNFNEAILLSIDPSENFEIVESDNGAASLEVLEVVLGSNTENVSNASAVITTSAQGAAGYTLSVTGVTDEAENDIDATSSVGTFTGMGEVETPDEDPDEDTDVDPDEDTGTDPDEDTVIPEPKDVAKLLAKSVMDAGKFNVTLTWDVPSTNKGQISEQVVYISEDSEDYDKKASLDADAEKYEAKSLEEGTYWFKVTQKDVEGNETVGTIEKIVLSETGPGLVGLVLVSLGLGRVVSRKKK